ncbi:flavin monoamine oxidase family protein [Rhodococcus koreensis]
MSSPAPRSDVIVIGAGIAGLVAAEALTRAGKTVACVEARERVGGRAASTLRGGLVVDLGATWFWPDETRVQELCTRLALQTFPQATHGDGLFEADQLGPRRLDGNPIDVPSRRFTTGAGALATALSDRLAGGTLLLGDPVHAIDTDRHGVQVTAASGRLAADHVIVAVPPPLAVESIAFTPKLPAPLQEAARRTAVWMGGTVKAVAIYDQPFWRNSALSGAAISYRGPFQEFHDHSGHDDRTPAALFGFAAAHHFIGAQEGDVASTFTRQLIRLFGQPAARPREILVTDWSAELYTSPANPLPTASTATYGHRLFHEPITDGRILWASTETSTTHAGHLDGAIHAGLTAARAICDRIEMLNGIPHGQQHARQPPAGSLVEVHHATSPRPTPPGHSSAPT